MTQADSTAECLIDLERRALDRWCHGDPSGFIELLARDVVYFDPFIEARIAGREQLIEYYEPLRGKIFAERFELINPRVHSFDKAAVLTFNFVSQSSNGREQRWNCTEVYRNDAEGWRLVQSHWSFTKAVPAG